MLQYEIPTVRVRGLSCAAAAVVKLCSRPGVQMSAATVPYGYKVLLQRLEGMGSWIELRAMPSHYGCSARGLGMLKVPLIIQSHCLSTYSIRSLPIYHDVASLLSLVAGTFWHV